MNHNILKSVHTRFRAFQLGNAGSSFLYFSNNYITLIEGRLTEINEKTLNAELNYLGKDRIDKLHITSWDQDHCSPNELIKLLENYMPEIIEYPGYDPHTQTAEKSLSIISEYCSEQNKLGRNVRCKKIDPDYIAGLDFSAKLGYNNIIYHPKHITPDNSNDNSTVQLFRSGCFNVRSRKSSATTKKMRMKRSLNTRTRNS